MEYFTENYLETQEIGRCLAEELKSGKKAAVFGLKGSLGAGKTTFLQGFAKGLGIKEKVVSPTFVIMNRFGIKKGRFRNFYHFDCYRLERAEELENLGYKEIISNPQNIVCIEWPERIKKLLPDDSILINFKILEGDNRKITINYGE